MTNILAVSGKLKHGKDSYCNFIIEELKKRNFQREIYKTAFANVIKEAALHLFPQLDPQVYYGPSELRNTPIEGFINPETGKQLIARDPLTMIGKWGRLCNPNCWVYATTYNFPKLIEEGKLIILSDCRFINEANHLHNMGAKIIRIIRPDVGFTTNDPSEIDLDDYKDFDKIIINDTMENLRKAAIEVINEYIL